jgi:hypothetical protein
VESSEESEDSSDEDTEDEGLTTEQKLKKTKRELREAREKMRTLLQACLITCIYIVTSIDGSVERVILQEVDGRRE